MENQQTLFFDFLLSMALSKPAQVDDNDKGEEAISLSLCNEVVAGIIGSHIGLVDNPSFFLIPVEVVVSDDNHNTTCLKLNGDQKFEQDFVETLREYNKDVRVDESNNLNVLDYYIQIHTPSQNISSFAFRVFQECEISKQKYNVGLTFKLYLPSISETENKLVYTNTSFIIFKRERKSAIQAFLGKMLLQSAYNLEHRRYDQAFNNAATVAAISQVMTRNLSHNIGSHVFSNLIEDKIYSNLEKKIDSDTYTPICKDTSKDSQLAYFNQYLKSRMDYLSEVTFVVSNVLSTKKIYDVFMELDRVRLLLNYISGISNFKYEFNLKYEEKELSKGMDISAAFPSDVLGCQAFYNIIENIIRNTAKHSDRNESQTIVFTIHIKNADENQPYYVIEIDDGISLDAEKIDLLIEKQNQRLCESVIDKEKRTLRNHSLGLLEMKASAAFLQQIDLPEIENRPDILQAFKTNANSLGYRFFINKPQEILLIGDWNIDTETGQKLMNQGIWQRTENALEEDLDNNRAFAHRFVVSLKTEKDFFSDEKSIKNKWDYKTLLPNKWICAESSDIKDINNLLNDASFDILKLEEKIWEIWNRQHQFDISKCSVEIDCPNTLPDYQIVLLNHLTDPVQKEKYKHLALSKKAWIEPLSSNAQKKLPYFPGGKLDKYKFFIKDNDFERKEIGTIVKNLLWDCYSHSVLVVDERIQEYSKLNRTDASEITNEMVFEKSGVFMTKTDLNANNLDDKLVDIIEEEIKEIESTFLLIHYGILERHYKNNKKDIENCLKTWVEKGIKVIVTSGRGKHSLDLPKNVCYLNLSSVLYAFVENQNKYSINYILNQARR
jgi:hypothetical protein